MATAGLVLGIVQVVLLVLFVVLVIILGTIDFGVYDYNSDDDTFDFTTTS